jgi:hypothetical protein
MQEVRCALPDRSLCGQEGFPEPGAGYEDCEGLPVLPNEQFQHDLSAGVAGHLTGKSDIELNN